MRQGVIFPMAFVGALVMALLVMHPRMSNEPPATAATAMPPRAAVADASQEARSAAAMMAQDPLPLLLTEHDRVLEERTRYLAALEAAYRAEPVDPQWADVTERALVDVSRGEALSATRITPDAWSVQCHARSCKIDAAFGDYDNAQDWANFFLTGTGDILAQAELSVQREVNGTTHVLIFGARR
jgi:hypothetical protein